LLACSELETNRELILVEIESLDRIKSASRVLSGLLHSAERQPTITVADSLAWLSTLWAPSLDPSLGAVEALIASGRLSQISDAELRSGLSGLRDRFADAIEEQVTARQVAVEQLMPLVRDVLDMDALMEVTVLLFEDSQGEERTPQERVQGRGMESRAQVLYPNSAAIRNTIRYKQGWLDVGRSEFAALVPRLERLIQAMVVEIEGT
jgi:hypothetical protein